MNSDKREIQAPVGAASAAEPMQSPADDADPPDEVPGVPGSGALNLPRWKAAVAAIREGKSREPARILWFGDSHTAGDYWPFAVRKALSKVLPLAGPGYVSLGLTGARHGLVRMWRDGPMEVAPHPPARRSEEDDGVFGLGGTRVTLKDSTAILSLKNQANELITAPSMNYQLVYRTTSGLDRLAVSTGIERREFARSDEQVGGLEVLRFSAPLQNTIEIRAIAGRPQVFGVIAETGISGVVVDTLGINGARFGTPLAWNENSFVQWVGARKPVAVVVAYGTNEVFDEELVSRHAQRLERLMSRIRAAAPDIDCIVAGPTDVGKGGTAAETRVAALDEAERAAAHRSGCAYFSPYTTMMQDGGFGGWAAHDPAWALSDGVHLTARGYARLGEAMAKQCFGIESDDAASARK